jgi:hypothetical protein
VPPFFICVNLRASAVKFLCSLESRSSAVVFLRSSAPIPFSFCSYETSVLSTNYHYFIRHDQSFLTQQSDAAIEQEPVGVVVKDYFDAVDRTDE